MPRQPRISDEAFVVAWMEALEYDKGYAYIAEKLGISVGYVGTKANYLRAADVRLPKMRNRPNTKILNLIIEGEK